MLSGPKSLRRWLAVGVVLLTGALSGLAGGYLFLRGQVPSIRAIEDYRPDQSTRLYSNDGYLVAELGLKKRRVVPVAEIPKHVVHAFLAAEDADFYEHEGLDYLGILRAAVKNLRPGAHLQGASTITQQLVKNLIVGDERSYLRKMREALLSYDLENLLTKDEILHLYLNEIYFGGQAYGVDAAAQLYFGRSVKKLSLEQAAYLAAIPKWPERYTLLKDPKAAKSRQRYVLERMQVNGWAEPLAVAKAIAAPILRPAEPPPFLDQTPHYVEHVRRLLVQDFGEERVLTGGLTVYLGMNAAAQVAAQDALRQGLEEVAKKNHGYAGARLRIEVDRYDELLAAMQQEFERLLDREAVFDGRRPADRTWDLRLAQAHHLASDATIRRALTLARLEEGEPITGVISNVDSANKDAHVNLGSAYVRLTLPDHRWARPFSDRGPGRTPRDPAEIFQRGDITTVTIEGPARSHRNGKPVYPGLLLPRRTAQGALVSVDPHTRYVAAMVGGYERRGELIRALQSKRQPGSAFKPVVYASALDLRAITPAATCSDSPVVIRDKWTGEAWKPDNYADGRYDGTITYRAALTKSKNTCSVKLIDTIKPEPVIAMARKLGIQSDLPRNLTLALGTGEVSPLELANAYATIASGGLFAEPIFIRKVTDVDGSILKEQRAEAQQVVDPAVAFVLTNMMQSVIEEGTATKALVLDRPLAGKTGTTNRARDAWFAGFARQLVAAVWVGFDDNRPLGRATGGGTALPIWVRYMGRALANSPILDFEPPPDVVFRRVDRDTGRPTEEVGYINEVFLAGTEPKVESQALPSMFVVDDE